MNHSCSNTRIQKNISHVSIYLDRIIRLKVKKERKKERARVFKDKEIW